MRNRQRANEERERERNREWWEEEVLALVLFIYVCCVVCRAAQNDDMKNCVACFRALLLLRSNRSCCDSYCRQQHRPSHPSSLPPLLRKATALRIYGFLNRKKFDGCLRHSAMPKRSEPNENEWAINVRVEEEKRFKATNTSAQEQQTSNSKQ